MEKFGVIELTSKEMISIDGGKSVSYYLGADYWGSGWNSCCSN